MVTFQGYPPSNLRRVLARLIMVFKNSKPKPRIRVCPCLRCNQLQKHTLVEYRTKELKWVKAWQCNVCGAK